MKLSAEFQVSAALSQVKDSEYPLNRKQVPRVGVGVLKKAKFFMPRLDRFISE
jgi:hypothetical protein